ncbi:polysaccharide biosynthesis protein, partial [[Ruminococcus] gnavus]|nr:polysaccharide biosynthesis protein [Mediterraneibacter gnavus]
VRFYSRYRVKDDQEGIAKLNGMFMIVFTVIAMIALLAGGILVSNVNNLFSKSLTVSEIDTARILMLLMVINLAISFPSSVFDSFV